MTLAATINTSNKRLLLKKCLSKSNAGAKEAIICYIWSKEIM